MNLTEMTGYFIMKGGKVFGSKIGYRTFTAAELALYGQYEDTEKYEIRKREFDVVFKDERPEDTRGGVFWVRCKTDKNENHWFNKGDVRQSRTIEDLDGHFTYHVNFSPDGDEAENDTFPSGIIYYDKERLLRDFDIVYKPEQ